MMAMTPSKQQGTTMATMIARGSMTKTIMMIQHANLILNTATTNEGKVMLEKEIKLDPRGIRCKCGCKCSIAKNWKLWTWRMQQPIWLNENPIALQGQWRRTMEGSRSQGIHMVHTCGVMSLSDNNYMAALVTCLVGQVTEKENGQKTNSVKRILIPNNCPHV